MHRCSAFVLATVTLWIVDRAAVSVTLLSDILGGAAVSIMCYQTLRHETLQPALLCSAVPPAST